MRAFVRACSGSIVAGALLLACGQANSPADSIALGRSHPCKDDAGVWDGLECATPHVQEPDEIPTGERPRPPASARKRVSGPMPPPKEQCDCDLDDPLCSCE